MLTSTSSALLKIPKGISDLILQKEIKIVFSSPLSRKTEVETQFLRFDILLYRNVLQKRFLTGGNLLLLFESNQDQESILPNFFSSETKNFSVFR